MLQDVDIKPRFFLLEVDDNCVMIVRKEGDDIAVFIKDEYEDFEVALAFNPERFQEFIQKLQEQ
jgi:hypothetical protein